MCSTASWHVLCVRQKGSHSCWKISGRISKLLPFLISLELQCLPGIISTVRYVFLFSVTELFLFFAAQFLSAHCEQAYGEIQMASRVNSNFWVLECLYKSVGQVIHCDV